MAILTNEQKQLFKPFINGFWTLVLVAMFVSLAARFIIGEYPGYISWLEDFFGFVIVIAAIFAGFIVADRNKLVK